MPKVSVPLRGSGKGKPSVPNTLHESKRFPSPCGEVVKERLNRTSSARALQIVSVPLRGSGKGKNSLRKPYQERVSDAKSTHQKIIVNKRQNFRNKLNLHRLKPLPSKQSTHLNEITRLSPIALHASITFLNKILGIKLSYS